MGDGWVHGVNVQGNKDGCCQWVLLCLAVFCQVGRVFEVGWDGGEKWFKEVQNPPGAHKELVSYKQCQTEVDVRFICKIVYWTKYCLATEAIIGKWSSQCTTLVSGFSGTVAPLSISRVPIRQPSEYWFRHDYHGSQPGHP